MNSIIILTTLLTVFIQTQAVDEVPVPKARPLTIFEFLSILQTEIENEVDLSTRTARGVRIWNLMTDHEWERGWDEEQIRGNTVPFLICNPNTDKRGWGRRNEVISTIQNVSPEENDPPKIVTVYNQEDMTCFLCLLRVSVASEIPEGMIVHPVSYAMKLLAGTIDAATMELDDEKQFRLDVLLCPGVLENSENVDVEGEELKTTVLDYIDSRREGTNQSVASESFFWTTLKDDEDVDEDRFEKDEFWEGVFNSSIDSDERVCDEAFDLLEFELVPSTGGEGSLGIMSISIGEITEYNNSNFTLIDECFLALIISLSLLPETCSLQVRPIFNTSNVEAQWIVHGFRGEGQTPFYDVGITGSGQIVAVSDTGIDMNNCYFWDNTKTGQNFKYSVNNIDLAQRKVVQYDPFVDNRDYQYGHGTHVCGSIVGHRAANGIDQLEGAANGVAFDAKVAFIDVGTSAGELRIPQTDQLLNTGRPNAKIHSASWGSVYPGIGITGRSFDQYIYENESFIVVVAAGNSGSGNNLMSVGDPSTAKNVIAVGAGQSDGTDLTSSMLGPEYVASFSSRGPTTDGRTKPDLIAPGSYILSAGALPSQIGECDPRDGSIPDPGKAREGLLSIQGTSMATPVTSATAALVRQYFEEGYYPTGKKNSSDVFNPSGYLIKAVLMNGAQYMIGVDNLFGLTPVKPYDMNQNFGRISLVDSLYLEGENTTHAELWDREVIDDGQTRVFNVTIDFSDGCNNMILSVTLVWSDPPAVTGCTSCLLNDLDLYITKNNETQIIFYPNGLTEKDSKNNAERVQIENVENGDVYYLNVKGHNLVTNSQKFALVATGCVGIPTRRIENIPDDYDPNKKKRTTIIAVVCGIAGAFLLSCLCYGMNKLKKRGERDDYPDEIPAVY